MAEYRPVPVQAAEYIAKTFNKSMVVVLAYDRVHAKTHTTTYGVSAIEKEQAAAVGEVCTNTIGADLSRKIVYEDFHRDYDPARFKESLEVLHAVNRALISLIAVRDGLTDEFLVKLRNRVAAVVTPIAAS
jgi:hypothetical protein